MQIYPYRSLISMFYVMVFGNFEIFNEKVFFEIFLRPQPMII